MELLIFWIEGWSGRKHWICIWMIIMLKWRLYKFHKFHVQQVFIQWCNVICKHISVQRKYSYSKTDLLFLKDILRYSYSKRDLLILFHAIYAYYGCCYFRKSVHLCQSQANPYIEEIYIHTEQNVSKNFREHNTLTHSWGKNWNVDDNISLKKFSFVHYFN